VDTGNQKRDDHLRSPDFFEVSTYPEIKFVIDGIEATSPTTAKATGKLTIKDVTKAVTFDVHDIAFGTGMRGRPMLGFEATTTIDRQDFHVSGGAPLVGNDVKITLNVEAGEAMAPPPAPAPAPASATPTGQ
jgi:polyisoprenoid-binding protein YceI